MSTAPEAPAGGVTSAGGAGERFQSCWSCRLLSGGGLLLSAAYVFSAARRLPIHGVPSIGMMTQITFAVCLASLGVVIIADPVQKKDLKSA
ncbi:hypothetical protein NQZ68_001713 [Dissostichus eleginoides]|uniref:Distal membrane-arm assembly complex protein 1 n=1 Tax=Dissostichus eleginoides TaxID=100907 RepID=A0AAD9EWN2_DISEL|nr:hypothetical protein NQZ68_001713 [Dissostichus eleginoides]KAK1879831.1 Distal membrane-arm assembly complex protein 1 [Dissostichus eleginoides]